MGKESNRQLATTNEAGRHDDEEKYLWDSWRVSVARSRKET